MILDKETIRKVDIKNIKESKVCKCACCNKELVEGAKSAAVFSNMLNQGVCLSCYFQADAPIICIENIKDEDVKEIARIALIDKCIENLQKVAI